MGGAGLDRSLIDNRGIKSRTINSKSSKLSLNGSFMSGFHALTEEKKSVKTGQNNNTCFCLFYYTNVEKLKPSNSTFSTLNF